MSANIHDAPAVRDLATALGTTAREQRSNMELLVFGATRRFGWSPSLQASSGFRADYTPDQAHEHRDQEGELQVLMNAYMRAVDQCPPWSDVLGAVHTLVLTRQGGEGLGQSFTPWDLADLSAALSLDQMTRHPPRLKDGRLKIHDPAVGCGGLLLGLFRGGFNPAICRIDAWDLDPLCCAMTALQFAANAFLHRSPVGHMVVRQGNTLTMKHRVVWVSERVDATDPGALFPHAMTSHVTTAGMTS